MVHAIRLVDERVPPSVSHVPLFPGPRHARACTCECARTGEWRRHLLAHAHGLMFLFLVQVVQGVYRSNLAWVKACTTLCTTLFPKWYMKREHRSGLRRRCTTHACTPRRTLWGFARMIGLAWPAASAVPGLYTNTGSRGVPPAGRTGGRRSRGGLRERMRRQKRLCHGLPARWRIECSSESDNGPQRPGRGCDIRCRQAS